MPNQKTDAWMIIAQFTQSPKLKTNNSKPNTQTPKLNNQIPKTQCPKT